MKQEALESALLTAKELSRIPNAPFLYSPPLDFVKKEIEKEPDRIKTAENAFAYFVNIKEGSPERKIFITTHLDHPFVILDGHGHGIPFGSIPPELLNQSPIKVFSRTGEPLGKGLIHSPSRKGNRLSVKIEGDPHPPNSQAIWDLDPPFKTHGNEAFLISADDIITTAAAIDAIKKIARHPHPLNTDITFIFTKVEEVRQISATGISLFKKTPFGSITPRDLVIPLEADHIEVSKKHSSVSEAINVPLPTPTGGVIIKTSNLNVVLGQQFPAPENHAEDTILDIAQKHSLRVQSCVAAGVDDGTAFTIFPTTPHIATLSLPNPLKHNSDGSGSPTYESVYLSDVSTLIKLLISLGTQSPEVSSHPHSKSVSGRLKQSSLRAEPSTVSRLRKEHLQALISSYPHLLLTKYFSETPLEWSLNTFFAVLARIIPPFIS